MLVSNTYELNLGTLTFGVPFKFKYLLTNTSKDKSVDITKVILGCGSCTVVSYNKRHLLPEDNVELDVIFTPGSTGLNVKNLTVQYSEEGTINPHIVLKFKSLVK